MKPQPFSPSGIAALQKELYEMPQPLLNEQADLIRNGFRDWVAAAFRLDGGQQSFFESLDDDFIFTISGSISIAVRNKRPIILKVQGKPAADSSARISKRLKMTSKVESGNGISGSGSVKLTVTYE